MAVWRDRRRADLGDLALMSRRFPPPWCVDEANNACFIVKLIELSTKTPARTWSALYQQRPLGSACFRRLQRRRRLGLDSRAKCNRALREPDLHVFAKLFEDCLKRSLEAQAFSGREIGGDDDVLDFLVGHFVDVDLTGQPAS